MKLLASIAATGTFICTTSRYRTPLQSTSGPCFTAMTWGTHSMRHTALLISTGPTAKGDSAMPTHSDDTARLARFRATLTRHLATSPAAVSDLHGRRPLIAVTEHEPLANILARATVTDGYATLGILYDNHTAMTATLTPPRNLPNTQDTPGSEPLTITGAHASALEIGAVLALVREHAHGITIRVTTNHLTGIVSEQRELQLQ